MLKLVLKPVAPKSFTKAASGPLYRLQGAITRRPCLTSHCLAWFSFPQPFSYQDANLYIPTNSIFKKWIPYPLFF